MFPLRELLWFFGTNILLPESTPEPLFRLLYQCYNSNRAGCTRASQLIEVGRMAYKCIHTNKQIPPKFMSTSGLQEHEIPTGLLRCKQWESHLHAFRSRSNTGPEGMWNILLNHYSRDQLFSNTQVGWKVETHSLQWSSSSSAVFPGGGSVRYENWEFGGIIRRTFDKRIPVRDWEIESHTWLRKPL